MVQVPGGASAPNFGGGAGGVSEIFGGSEIFFLFFSNFFPPQKNPSGMHTHTHTPPPPPDGQCAAGTHPTGMHSCFYANCEQRFMPQSVVVFKKAIHQTCTIYL